MKPILTPEFLNKKASQYHLKNMKQEFNELMSFAKGLLSYKDTQGINRNLLACEIRNKRNEAFEIKANCLKLYGKF